MAIFRKIHITFWSDPFISELKQDEKLFYIYLLTNPNTSQCGIYEITQKQIAFDLGYSIDRVSVLLKYFISKGKIRYNNTTFELAIKNWGKYNDSTSPKVKTHVNKELAKVKDRVLIEYLYSMDTQTQQEEEQEEETEQEPEKKLLFERFWNLYDKKEGRKDCERKFAKLKQTDIDKIFETLPTYIASTPDKKFRKMPETYLNGEHWNDEIVSVPQQTYTKAAPTGKDDKW